MVLQIYNIIRHYIHNLTLVLFEKSSKDPRILTRELHLPATIGFDLGFDNFSKEPDVIDKKYKPLQNTYISIYFNKAYLKSGIYDSTIYICDKNDNIVKEIKYFDRDRLKAEIATPDFKLTSIKQNNWNSEGLLITTINDDHYSGGSNKTTYKFKKRGNKIIMIEEYNEYFDDKGKLTESGMETKEFDVAGNIIKINYNWTSHNTNSDIKQKSKKKTFAYDSKGNKISEKKYENEILITSETWKFNNYGLITEYQIADKENGKINKLG